MDSLTQIVLGAAVGEAVLGRKVGNKAILWGAIAGTIPDLDVVFSLFYDKVTANELHRGFSHSIVFCVMLAPILGGLVFRWYKKKQASFKGWTLLFFFSLVTHPLLDAHTTWGTQLFWPLPVKLSYRNIFVIDPLYTLPFLFFLIAAMLSKQGSLKRKRLNLWGLYVSSFYMSITLLAKAYTYTIFKYSLEKQHTAYTEIQTKPTPLNTVLWTANVATENSYLIGYYSFFDSSKDVVFTEYPKNIHLLGAWKNAAVVQRLKRMSQGWYTISKRDGILYFNDLRFGLMGVSHSEDRFVFSYELYEESGELKAREYIKKREDVKPLLRNLWQRILGV
ncbi:MAG: metal-dependent hydrolase [Flavicella sp.]